MEDRRAHDRIDNIEKTLAVHAARQTSLEGAIKDNTRITQEVADNTSELVSLFRGAKGMRSFVMWMWPFLLVISAMLAGAWAYLRGN